MSWFVVYHTRTVRCPRAPDEMLDWMILWARRVVSPMYSANTNGCPCLWAPTPTPTPIPFLVIFCYLLVLLSSSVLFIHVYSFWIVLSSSYVYASSLFRVSYVVWLHCPRELLLYASFQIVICLSFFSVVSLYYSFWSFLTLYVIHNYVWPFFHFFSWR